MSENIQKITEIKKNFEKIKIENLGYEKIEIPTNLETRNIVGTAYLIDDSGQKIPVFVSQINPNDMSFGRRSNAAYMILDKEGDSYGNLALSQKHTSNSKIGPYVADNTTETNYTHIDWISTKGCPKNLKGVGTLLYQIAIEESHQNGHSGSLHLRSLPSARGFHHLQGARHYISDQYLPPDENGDTEKYSTHYGLKQQHLDHSSKYDQLDRSILQQGERLQDAGKSHFGDPRDEDPMRMSEHSGYYANPNEKTFTDCFQDEDGEDMLKMQTYLKWLEERGKSPKNKMYWIKQIQSNPILSSIRQKLKSGEIILD